MIPIQKILRYFVTFIVLYFLFVQAFQFMFRQEAASRFFLGTTQSVVSTLLPKAFFQMSPPAAKDRTAYSYEMGIDYASMEAVRQAQKAAGKSSQTRIDTVKVPYDLFLLLFIPLSFLYSLIIAMPLGWKKKLSSIAIGTGIFLLFSWLRITIYLLSSFSINPVGVYEWTQNWSDYLLMASKMFELGGTLIVVLIIWAFLTFGKKLLPAGKSASDRPTGSTARPLRQKHFSQ